MSHLERHRKAVHSNNTNEVKHSAWKYKSEFRHKVAVFAFGESVEKAGEIFNVAESTIRSWLKVMNRKIECNLCAKAFVERKKLTKHIESIHASANKGILTEEIKESEDTNQISNDSMMAEMGKSEDINQTSYGSGDARNEEQVGKPQGDTE